MLTQEQQFKLLKINFFVFDHLLSSLEEVTEQESNLTGSLIDDLFTLLPDLDYLEILLATKQNLESLFELTTDVDVDIDIQLDNLASNLPRNLFEKKTLLLSAPHKKLLDYISISLAKLIKKKKSRFIWNNLFLRKSLLISEMSLKTIAIRKLYLPDKLL